jgi:predicted exporter
LRQLAAFRQIAAADAAADFAAAVFAIAMMPFSLPRYFIFTPLIASILRYAAIIFASADAIAAIAIFAHIAILMITLSCLRRRFSPPRAISCSRFSPDCRRRYAERHHAIFFQAAAIFIFTILLTIHFFISSRRLALHFRHFFRRCR